MKVGDLVKMDFEALELNIENVFLLAEKKQLAALQDFVSELGLSPRIWESVQYLSVFKRGDYLHESR